MFRKIRISGSPSIRVHAGLSVLCKKIVAAAVCMIMVLSYHSVAICESLDESETLTQEELLALVTDDYIKETQDMFFDFDSPLPAEKINNCYEAWKIRTFEDYKDYYREKGETDEYWLEVATKGRLAFLNEKYMGAEGGFADIVSLEEFDNDVLSHNIEYFFCDDEGGPLSYKVGFTSQITEGLNSGVEKLINAGVDNFYEAWRDSGAAILYAGYLEPGGASISLVNPYGVIGFNMTEGNIGGVKLDYIFARALAELDSIGFAQRAMALGLNKVEGITGPAWIGYREVVKLSIYGEMLTCLNDELLNKLGNGLINQAESKADIYSEYGVSVDSDLTKRLIELALTGEVPGKKFLVSGE